MNIIKLKLKIIEAITLFRETYEVPVYVYYDVSYDNYIVTKEKLINKELIKAIINEHDCFIEEIEKVKFSNIKIIAKGNGKYDIDEDAGIDDFREFTSNDNYSLSYNYYEKQILLTIYKDNLDDPEKYYDYYVFETEKQNRIFGCECCETISFEFIKKIWF
jgi:hypothetical protein